MPLDTDLEADLGELCKECLQFAEAVGEVTNLTPLRAWDLIMSA